MKKLTFHCGAQATIDGDGYKEFTGQSFKEDGAFQVYLTDSIDAPLLPDGSPAPCVQSCPKKRPSGRKVKRIFVDKYAPLGYLITCVPMKVEEVEG